MGRAFGDVVAGVQALTDQGFTGPYALVDGSGRLLAVYEQRDERLKPSVVLNVDAGTDGGGN